MLAAIAALFLLFPPSARAWAPADPAGQAASAEVPEARPAPPADWTVLYFINGKNDLESSAMMDMNQLELAGSDARVKIVAELGRMSGQEGDDQSEGGWTGVRRYLVERDTDTVAINSPVLQELGAADMGSWKELVSFITWAKTTFPARRYALVLWDHGNGWLHVDAANAAEYYNLKSFSLDEETGHEFSLPQMAEALKRAGGVDFLMLDGCNMAMASVAYELRNAAAALTFSEEYEPGVTIRYAQFLGMLKARPEMGPEEFAVNTVRTYGDYFQAGGDNGGAPLTQSAVRLPKMGLFREKLDAWAAAAMKAEPAALRRARDGARFYGDFPPYKDLCDFVGLAAAASSDPAFRDLSAGLIRFVEKELVIENWAQDEASRGLAVYVPSRYDPLYDGLGIARDGLWDDFARYISGLE